VGETRLAHEILDAGDGTREFPVAAGSFPPFASLDHVNFSEAGVAAVTITYRDDAAIHTSKNAVQSILMEALQMMLAIVDAELTEQTSAR
jgi:hypothetical protein